MLARFATSALDMPSQSPPRPRIIIADDHPEMLARTREVLAADFEVVAAVSDGMAAVDAATRLHPDVVVLDISMPVISGVEAATRLLATKSPPIVVFLTVHEDSAYRDMAERLGVAAYVLKRDILNGLVGSIQRALAAAKAALP
jgi:DNA-binding NarL/FixJ family response regulator